MIGSLTARLLDATGEDHGALESTSFFGALEARTLPPQKLYQMLSAHYVTADGLERSIRSSDNAMLRALWREDMAKSELLSSDLVMVESLIPGAAGTRPPASVVEATSEYVRYVRYAACTQPLALAGYLFAHEGSMLEAPVRRSHAAAVLGVSSDRIRYYNAYPDPMGRWRRFRQQLEQEVVTTGQQDVVVAGARDAFRLLRQLYEAISEDSASWHPDSEEFDVSEPVGVVMERSRRESSTSAHAR